MKKIELFRKRVLIIVLTSLMICGVAPGVFAEEATEPSGEAIVQTEEKADTPDPADTADLVAPTETEQAVLAEGPEAEAGSDQPKEAALQDVESSAVRVDLTGSVGLSGKDLTAGLFSFTVKDVTDRNNIKSVITVKNDKEGNYSFTLPFYDEGVFSFEITQDPVTTGDITVDNHVYPFKVITEKNTEGKLTYKVVDDSNKQIDIASSSVFKFTNQSKSNSDNSNNSNNNNSNNSNNDNSNNNNSNNSNNTNNNKETTVSKFNSTGKITGEVKLTGKTLAKDDFSFTLKDTTESTPEADRKTWTVKNESDGTFSFDQINYEKEGEYTYTINQEKGSASGITYDTTEYKATVKVSKQDDGSMKSEMTKLTKGSNNTDALSSGIVYNNQYKSSSASNSSGNTSTTGKTNTSNTTGDKSPADKSTSNPKTGDVSTIGFYSALLAGFVIVLIVTLFSFRKRKGHSK